MSKNKNDLFSEIFINILTIHLSYSIEHNTSLGMSEIKLYVDDVVCNCIGIPPQAFNNRLPDMVYGEIARIMAREMVEFLKTRYAHPCYMNDEDKKKRQLEINKMLRIDSEDNHDFNN